MQHAVRVKLVAESAGEGVSFGTCCTLLNMQADFCAEVDCKKRITAMSRSLRIACASAIAGPSFSFNDTISQGQ